MELKIYRFNSGAEMRRFRDEIGEKAVNYGIFTDENGKINWYVLVS